MFGSPLQTWILSTSRSGGKGNRKKCNRVQGDVANLDDLDRLFAQIKREKGKLDIVFANAGVAKYAPLGSITEDLYDSIFSINVKGSFSRCRRRCRCCRMEHLLS